MRALTLSKTFSGTVSFDFKMVLTDNSIDDLIQYIDTMVAQGGAQPGFSQYVQALPQEERIASLTRKMFRGQLKAILQEIHEDTANAGHGNSFTFSPISIKIKGKV